MTEILGENYIPETLEKHYTPELSEKRYITETFEKHCITSEKARFGLKFGKENFFYSFLVGIKKADQS
jgi:hypothetical protein